MASSRNPTFSQHLARRVSLRRDETPAVAFDDAAIPEGLTDYLREHLARGETHYTTRPGLTELRQTIATEIARLGGPARNADSAIVTQGEGEALYVTLLGLGVAADSIVVVTGECRHRGLFDLLSIEMVAPTDSKAGSAVAVYSEIAGEPLDLPRPTNDQRFEILALGGLLFSERGCETDLSSLSSRTLLIGHLDSLPGLDHFRMAFVAGPPDLVKRIQIWKQALSICSAAPSQRAAMFAIGMERIR